MIKSKLPLKTVSVHLFETDAHPFDVSRWKLIKSILEDTSFFKKRPVQIVADPFLYVHHDWLYLFYEKLIYTGIGIIEMVKTNDLLYWTEPVTVLKRSTHLSYPCVFNHADSILMIPETYQEKNVQLLKANQDLTEWSLEKVILHGDKYVDTSIILHDHVYYLFTTALRPNNEYELQLYFSNELYGEFEKHPKSPIAIGHSAGRCGGAIFELDNKIYRPAQICEHYYGESLSIYRIKELTTTDYQEEIEIDRLLSKQFRHGGHHLNMVKFNQKTIIATDAMNFLFNFWAFRDKVMKKLGMADVKQSDSFS